ncbi:HAD family hydrolase [Evansella cellulosilytica]|uniref:HAD-superfamily hydrolase, subfamily IA, variant 1 n=1 Tax=Evansella cellulosilytica (strain ATCC 21833 / DSM 2522 / FERM P-1141 / JCM 9156 / N-4) TaxID=649639 RepID=E6TWD4_EVAC2|nr:HAD family hydrolase [Evansella cellulosilytica]ADU31090.1 HAD-superfamily hydrolase, subfamily IA, variant 1 [Evansella cellulosilytica DSM 2522]
MIFFDIDGTLLDHEKAEEMAAVEFYLEHVNTIAMRQSQFLDHWKFLSKKYFDLYLKNQISFQQQRRMRIKEMIQTPLNDEEADTKFAFFLHLYKKYWLVYDDVIPSLTSLKKLGFRLGIISNGQYNQQIEKLERTGILPYFDCVVTSSEVKEPKPSSVIFQEACHKANVKLSECTYIGDILETDALGSKNAGMHGVWLNRKYNQKAHEVTVINRLTELEPIIIMGK